MKFTSVELIAPFAAWMALMTLLPSTLAGYAVRTAVTAALLIYSLRRYRPHKDAILNSLLWGIPVGLAVFAVWVFPEQFDWQWYKSWCIIGEGGTTGLGSTSGNDLTLIAVRLLGSAFVIAVAEELFFRKWLIGFAGFWWMTALFALEHDRYVVGAIAGVVYGALYLRHGLGSAIVAHIVTNLTLGIWVLMTGQWQFW